MSQSDSPTDKPTSKECFTQQNFRALRTFVPSKDYETSQRFYAELGFETTYSDQSLTVLVKDGFSFYLQKYYVQEWADNFMMFAEVADIDQFWRDLVALDLPSRYDGIRLTEPVDEDWGRVGRLIDPSGVLWHFATFKE